MNVCVLHNDRTLWSANNLLLKAFFNTILRDLGVKDVKTQELFTIDQSSLDLLPYVIPPCIQA